MTVNVQPGHTVGTKGQLIVLYSYQEVQRDYLFDSDDLKSQCFILVFPHFERFGPYYRRSRTS